MCVFTPLLTCFTGVNLCVFMILLLLTYDCAGEFVCFVSFLIAVSLVLLCINVSPFYFEFSSLVIIVVFLPVFSLIKMCCCVFPCFSFSFFFSCF